MSAKIFFSFYLGRWGREDADLILLDVPPRLRRHLPAANHDRWAYVYRFWVKAKLRGGGVGRELFTEALRATDALKLSLILRCVPFDRKDGDAAVLRKFYESHGFLAVEGEVMIRSYR